MSQDCVMILSSDNDDVEVVEDANKNPNNQKRISLQTVVTGKEIFAKFLGKCKSIDSSSDMEKIVNKKLWKRFYEAREEYTSSRIFINLVQKVMANLPKDPYTQLKVVADELKHHKGAVLPSTSAEVAADSGEKEMDPKTALHIKKLEKVLKKLNSRIQKLESVDVDLNSSDDENSAYIQVSRYKEKICQVFKKLCELQKKDPHAERPYRKRVKFDGTNIPAVNKAIEKFYNDRKEFPDYRDILKVVQKANEVKELNLLPHEVNDVAVRAFLNFGKTLKTWRQYDDLETFSLYATNEEDPASQDETLKTRLEENRRKYANRIDEVIDKYASKQNEENLQPEVVNSDAKSSESEGDDEEEEELESDCRSRSSILEWKSNPDSADSSDMETKNNAKSNCKIVLFDVRLTPEWQKYMEKVETTTNKQPPWLSQKRPNSSDDESPSFKRVKTIASVEPIPSIFQQSVPIVLENFRHVSNESHSSVFNDKTVQNATAQENQSPKSSIELQISPDDENDVIEIVSDSCDKVANENENENIIKAHEKQDSSEFSHPHRAQDHENAQISEKNEKSIKYDKPLDTLPKTNVKDSEKEVKIGNKPSATPSDEIINVDVPAEGSESKTSTDTYVAPHTIENIIIVGVEDSETKTTTSPIKSLDDIICVEDTVSKEIVENRSAFDNVCSKQSINIETIDDVPISASFESDVCVAENESQSQGNAIDMPLEVIITSDPLAENSKSLDASLSNKSKSKGTDLVVDADNPESINLINESDSANKVSTEQKVNTNQSSTEHSPKKSTNGDEKNIDEKIQTAKENEEEVMIIDEIVKPKTSDKTETHKNDEVIDVEDIADSPPPKKLKQTTIGLSPINLTQIIRNMNFDKNIGKRNPQPNRMPIPSTSQGFGNARRNDVRNTRVNNTVRELALFNQGASKQPPFQCQPSNFQVVQNPSFQRGPLNNGSNRNTQFFSNNRNVAGQSAQAAMHKRQCTTTHTMQKFDKRNNCVVTRKQITTVVEESVMNISNAKMSSNGNFQMVGQRTRVVNRRMQQVQRSTRSSNRGNPSEDIITLD